MRSAFGNLRPVQPSRPFVTVVSGVPRSGTSLVMQMLAAGGLAPFCDEARPADRHNPRGYFEAEVVKRLRRDAGWLPAARGTAVKVVHALVEALPAEFDYRLILVRRDLREVVASQQAMLPAGAREAGVLAPERLVEIFAAQLEALERQVIARPEFRLLRVEHRELLRSPAEQAARLDVFVGGGLDVAAMAAAVDPALYRQRRVAPSSRS